MVSARYSKSTEEDEKELEMLALKEKPQTSSKHTHATTAR